jgi:hypothetical protein
MSATCIASLSAIYLIVGKNSERRGDPISLRVMTRRSYLGEIHSTETLVWAQSIPKRVEKLRRDIIFLSPSQKGSTNMRQEVNVMKQLMMLR